MSQETVENLSRTRDVEGGGQSDKDSNEPDHTNLVRERRRPFVRLTTGLRSTTTLGNALISTTTSSKTTQWVL
jgi:hypothetical protein